MATIRKRGDYQWQVMIRRKGHAVQSKTFETKESAIKWARLIEGEIDRGVFFSRDIQEKTLLSEALNRYLNEVTPHKKGAERERNRIKQLMRHPLADRFLANIRSFDIANYRDERMNEGISPSTYQKEHALFSHVFDVARKEWGMESLTNPCKGVRIPVICNARDRRLSGDEELRLFEVLATEEMRVIVTIALETTMRRSEIIDLRWENVDMERRQLVSKNKDIHGKNAKKVIPLSRTAIRVLKKVPRNISGKIFKLDADQVTRRFTRAIKKAGLEDFRFHDLRHEATSRLFEKGLTAEEVMKITGHRTYAMLARYTHLRSTNILQKIG